MALVAETSPKGIWLDERMKANNYFRGDGVPPPVVKWHGEESGMIEMFNLLGFMRVANSTAMCGAKILVGGSMRINKPSRSQ